MKMRIVIALFLSAAMSALAADTQVKGYLVDLDCAREEGQRPNFGAKHTKACLRMQDCANDGYGLLTDDKRIIRFDKAGNEEAKEFIAATSKTSDFKVTVTGSVDGEQMTVSKIELQ